MNRFKSASMLAALTVVTLIAGACKGESTSTVPSTTEKKSAAPDVTPTGDTIVVEAFSDGAGNFFKPNQVDAHRGDVVRFVLRSGVHNVHFLADSNPGAANLPEPSDMLQLPGQTYDVLVSFTSGQYFFQCDPHAMLGMVGHIKVN